MKVKNAFISSHKRINSAMDCFKQRKINDSPQSNQYLGTENMLTNLGTSLKSYTLQLSNHLSPSGQNNKNDSENSSKGRKRSLSKCVNNEDTLLVSDPSRVDSITPNSSLNKTSKWYNPTCKTKSSNAVNLNCGGLLRKKSIIYKPKSKISAKPPLARKGFMAKKIKLHGGVEYICRLENNLSVSEVNNRFHLLNESKISCSSNTIIECVKNPKVTVRDIYDKITYDTVRRNIEHNVKPIFLGRKTKGQVEEQTKLNKKKDEEIMHMHFGERKYKDWISFNKVHDFTVTK